MVISLDGFAYASETLKLRTVAKDECHHALTYNYTAARLMAASMIGAEGVWGGGERAGEESPYLQSSMAAAAAACSRCRSSSPQCRLNAFTQL